MFLGLNMFEHIQCFKLVKTRSQYHDCVQSYWILKFVKPQIWKINILRKMALKTKNCVSSSINVILQKPKKYGKSNRKVRKSIKLTQTYTNISFLMKTKNWHILTSSDKMQICAASCFATCDWFCPMMSQISFLYLLKCCTTSNSIPCLKCIPVMWTTKYDIWNGGNI